MRSRTGIEELPGVLGIALGQEFHRALEVGKQHGDLLALAFQGTAGGENFLRQIGWGVGEGCLVRVAGAAAAAAGAVPRRSRPAPCPPHRRARRWHLDEFDL